MSRQDKDEVARAIKQPLFTLVQSTKRHLEGGDRERLQARRPHSQGDRHHSPGAEGQRLPQGRGLHREASRFMVPFAELALEGVRIPYTTNRIERLMGEISKRCKHRWMHWSTTGLRNILSLVLVRYTDGMPYENFKNGYIYNETFT